MFDGTAQMIEIWRWESTILQQKQHTHINCNAIAGGRLRYYTIVEQNDFFVPSSIAEGDVDITDVPGIGPSESIVIGITHDYIFEKISFEQHHYPSLRSLRWKPLILTRPQHIPVPVVMTKCYDAVVNSAKTFSRFWLRHWQNMYSKLYTML